MRLKQGKVVSNKMAKTAVVEVHAYKSHAKYLKRFRVTKRFYVHDPEQKCKVGDTVVIYETRPLSKLKRWRLKEIVK